MGQTRKSHSKEFKAKVALDNVFIERLWRSVKYEDVYLRDYADGHALHRGLSRYFRFYNHERPHSSPGTAPQTPPAEGLTAPAEPATVSPRRAQARRRPPS